VRERFQHIVRRTPQVMVRISGGGRGMRHIRAHLDYISRHGQLALEDHEGERHLGNEDLAWLGYTWQAGGVPIAEHSERREALNIVLSMPAGTDALSLQRAACAFAAGEFTGHQYVLALHTPEADPSRHASLQPHLHLCVKMAGEGGRRLNPRKEDLRRWREDFASRLREHGIDAAASSRQERFQPRPGQQQSMRHMLARGATLTRPQGAGPSGQIQHVRQHGLSVATRYVEVARLLASSDQAEDRALALGILEYTGRELGIDRLPERQR